MNPKTPSSVSVVAGVVGIAYRACKQAGVTTVAHELGAGFALSSKRISLFATGTGISTSGSPEMRANEVVGCTSSTNSNRSSGREYSSVRIIRSPLSTCTYCAKAVSKSALAWETGSVKLTQSSKAPVVLYAESGTSFSASHAETASSAPSLGSANALTYIEEIFD